MKTETFIIKALIIVIVVMVGMCILYLYYDGNTKGYSPGPEVHRLDSINRVLTDSVKFWKQKQDYADRNLKKLDSVINIQKVKYEKLRKKIIDANADDSNLILNGFLSE